MKVLILGINGFIGSNLTAAILKQTDWDVYGMDLATNKLEDFPNHPRCHFMEGDVTINKEWVEYHVKKCDVILPLVAVATPMVYVQDPMRVFELDFESNLPIIRQAVKYHKHLIFPSTSEVYGISPDSILAEETSPLMQGPINKERWIYSSCKQLLDRIIYAYGTHGDLQFTLFRPFNWTGPKLDDVKNLNAGGSRVVTQFISNIIHGKDLQLVDGGSQRRSFTYIDDAIGAMLKIIANKDGCANNRIFNIGNPSNDASIKDIAEKVLALAATYPKYKNIKQQIKINSIQAEKYYGKNYQDVISRVPSIQNAATYLNWKPTTNLDDLLKHTLDYYLAQ